MESNGSLQEWRCPFTRDPFPECYVSRLRSQDVGNAILYCGGVFEECQIYQKHLRSSKDESSANDIPLPPHVLFVMLSETDGILALSQYAA